MNDLVTYSILFLGLAILITLIWNAFNFIKLQKQTVSKKIDDARYWELKSRLDFITAVAALLIGFFSFVGYV
jgi:formate-dependent nitrite reductase membrane component NrfD